LFVGELSRHERDSEELTVRVLHRCTGRAPVIDDYLGVSYDLRVGVSVHSISNRRHDYGELSIVEVGPTGCVILGEDQDFMDP
jgi:hypothetical protein